MCVCAITGCRMRETDRLGERGRTTDRERGERQTGIERGGRQRERQKEKRGRQTDRQIEGERKTDSEVDIETDREGERKKEREMDGDRQRGELERQRGSIERGRISTDCLRLPPPPRPLAFFPSCEVEWWKCVNRIEDRQRPASILATSFAPSLVRSLAPESILPPLPLAPAPAYDHTSTTPIVIDIDSCGHCHTLIRPVAVRPAGWLAGCLPVLFLAGAIIRVVTASCRRPLGSLT